MLLEPIDDARTDAISRALSNGAPVKICMSRPLAFNDLAVALERADDVGSVEVLTDDGTVSTLREHFHTGAKLHEFTRNGSVEIRSQSNPLPTLLLSDTTATAVTGFPGGTQTSLETADEAFIEESTHTFTKRFEEASTVSIRTPPYSVLVCELEEWFDAEVRADFEAALLAARNSKHPSLSLHHATLSLLVGALHELQYYELGRWSEETRLASKATLARKKDNLEEAGVIDTESVPRQVGRPRHRLLLGEAIDETGGIEAIVTVASDE